MQHHRFDLVLLDMNMPGPGGIEVCRQIRKIAPHAGILMLTVRNLEEDRVRALEAGADDYITKPFMLRELAARLRAVLRRTRTHPAPEPLTIQVGVLKIDLEPRLLCRGEEDIHLSPKEFELLAFMMKSAGAPLTHIMLRKKIEYDPSRPECILTEPWVGYRFQNPSESHVRSAQNDGT